MRCAESNSAVFVQGKHLKVTLTSGVRVVIIKDIVSNKNKSMQTKRLQIIGRVTRVGFRTYTKKVASALNLAGWVQNVYLQPSIYGPNGGVEAEVQGKPDVIKQFVRNLKKGPGKVSRIEERIIKANTQYQDFQIHR